VRHCVLENLDPLRRQLDGHVRDAGDIAVWMREAPNQSGADGVAGRNGDDRNGACRALDRKGRWVTDHYYQVGPCGGEFGCHCRESACVALCPAPVVLHITTFDIAELGEPLAQRCGHRAVRRSSTAREVADTRRLRRTLAKRREWYR